MKLQQRSARRMAASARNLWSRRWGLRWLAVGAAIAPACAHANDATWTGNADNNWFNDANWSPTLAPGIGGSDTATFNNAGNGHTSVNIPPPFPSLFIDAIIFDGGAASYTFSGSSIFGTSGGEIAMNSSVSNSQTFLSELQIPAQGMFTLSNDASVGTATLNYGGSILPASGPTFPTSGTLVLAGGNIGNNIVSGKISDNGSQAISVTKNGAGTWILSNVNSYTGATIVGAGTLAVSGSTASSATTVSGGTLAGTGTVGDVTVSSGTVAPGDGTAGSIGTLTANSLTMNGGALLFDVGPTNANDKLSVTKAATFGAGSVLNLALNGPVHKGDVFTLLTSASLTNNGLTLNPLTIDRTTLAPSISGNNIIVTATSGVANLIWNNAGGTGDGSTWDVQTNQNWNNAGTPDVFFKWDTVNFTDANNGHYDVNVTAAVLPGSIAVNNSLGNYTIGGTGSIGGATGITKLGSAGLTLSSANTFTGAIAIQNGSITVGAAGAIPAGDSVTLGGAGAKSGVLDLGGIGATVGGLAVSGIGNANAVTNNGASPATLTFTNGTSTFRGVIQDGTSTTALAVSSGALTLSGANTYTGGTNVTGGSLTLSGANTYTGGTSITGGSLTISGSIADPSVTVGSGGTLTVASGGNIATTTNLTDNGTINFNSPTPTLATLNGSGVLSLNGTALTVSNGGTFSGAINDGASPGSLTASGGSLVLSGNSGYTGNTNISSGATVQIATSTSLGARFSKFGNIFVASGGTLDVGGANSQNSIGLGSKVVHIQGTGASNAGAITNSSGTPQSFAFSDITLDGDATITGMGFDIALLLPRVVTSTLDLQGHKLTTAMSGAFPFFGIDDRVNVTAGQIEVATGGLLIKDSAHVASDTSGSTITFDSGTSAEFFNTVGTAITRPMIFAGNNVIATFPSTVSTVNSNMTLNGNVTVKGIMLAGNLLQGTGSSTVTAEGIFSGTNTYTGGTIVFTNGELDIDSNGALPAGGAVTNNGLLNINANSTTGQITGTLGHLTLGTTAGPNSNTLTLASGSGQSTEESLTVNTGSTLDITNNSFDLHYGANASPDTTIRGEIISGYKSGTWTGTGITSSTAAGDTIHHAVGYADGADNVVQGLSSGDELIKYTFAGDANLDGKVDVADLGILATNYGKTTGQRWDTGDFTYDSSVDVSDLGVLATNYGAGTGISGAAAAAEFQSDLKLVESQNPAFAQLIGVPEPGTAALACLGAAGLFARRRRCRG